MDEEKTAPLHKGQPEEVAREVGHQRSSDVGLPLSNNPPQPKRKDSVVYVPTGCFILST